MKTKIIIDSNKKILLEGGKVLDVVNNKFSNNDILIQNGKIIEFGNISKENSFHIINCKNKIITQSFIDIHTHLKVTGVGDQEDLASITNAALSGGYSKLCVVPEKKTDNPELIELTKRLNSVNFVELYPMGCITKKSEGLEIAEFGLMVEKGAIAFSDSNQPIMNAQVMRYALEYAKMFNVPVINHPQDINLVNNGVMNESSVSNILGMNGNPSLAESIMIFRDLKIAEYINGKIHIPNITSSCSVDLVKEFKTKKVDVTTEVSPINLFFTDKNLSEYDTNLKISPPIRSKHDQESLIEALRDGTIDCIASIHNPHREDDKDKDFYNASYGAIGLETAFAATNTVLSKNNFSFESIIKLFSIKPAKIMNIEILEIRVNKKADLVIIDPDKEWVFKEEDVYSKSNNTPFINKTFKGKVDYTISKNILFG
jgi:dihydroorotase